ncbi:MAG: DUF1549 and DUF1553 domain-containing protein [Gemmataceae bacterium]
MTSPRVGSRILTLALWVVLLTSADLLAAFQVQPEVVKLEGNHARLQVVVTAADGQGRSDVRSIDLTSRARFRLARPDLAVVNQAGQMLALANGTTVLHVQVDGTEKQVPVQISGVVPRPTIGFADQVMPILTRAGCNAGACHAAQHGKGSFKLSVFASEPGQDHEAIYRGALGRRLSFVDPSVSLLLRKGCGDALHGGGKRLEPARPGQPVTHRQADYLILEQWIAGGAPGPVANPPKVTELDVYPSQRVGTIGQTQQLRVVAKYSTGITRDVTAWARFDSTDEGVVRVNADGMVQMVGRGLGASMVRFDGHAVLARCSVPFSDKVDLAGWTDNTFLDRIARNRFQELGISPSALCDDATFLRRAFLDAIGTLPTVEQTRAFLASTDPQKRTKLIDRLLGLTGDPAQDIHTAEYAALWSLKWSDLLKSNSATIGEQGMWSLHNWMKEAFRQNKPFDRVVRELITARGNPYDSGPANYFVAFQGAEALAEATSQVFLGMRVTCAKCHHHPFERISRNDFNGLADFFRQVASKPSAGYGKLGGPSVILVRSDDTPQKYPATILGMTVPRTLAGDKRDRRELLADWLTAPGNKVLARNVVNRYMAYLLGRGLIEPIDDLRATNAASNPEMLDALADEFIKHNYDLRKLMRTIMTSRLYQLSSTPTASNAGDRVFYSHYLVKRIGAEVLLDAIDTATGTQTRFEKLPLGTRAIELPDAKYDNYLLTVFGKPKRDNVCECERVTDPNLAQALHTLNSETIVAKIAQGDSRVARLLSTKKTDPEIVEELYLATLCRMPTAAEQTALARLRAETPDHAVFFQDLLWSLLNSKQFLFVR